MPNVTSVSPAVGAIVVTPSNSADLSLPIRALTINVAGTVSFIGPDGATYTTDTLPAGTYSIAATRIRSTGTTATGLTGWV
jgi:hypothetical protein